jgi:glutamine amidotransferase
MIAIVDYNIGNISAVSNMLQYLGAQCRITSSPEVLEQADRIILPGNGSFDACMRNLHASGMVPMLEHQVLQRGVPLLGICVGAQMLGLGSTEGIDSGLGWIDMRVERLPNISGLRIPHMGWNRVQSVQKDHPLTQNMEEHTRFYFVHSYYLVPKKLDDVLLQVHYGIEFSAAVAHNNIVGVQFHPEKSHRFGKTLLSSFIRWNP